MTKIKLLIYVFEKGHSVFIRGTWEHRVSAAQGLSDMQFGLKRTRPVTKY